MICSESYGIRPGDLSDDDVLVLRLVAELKELELAHEDAIRELKQENDKNVTKLRQQCARYTHSHGPCLS